MVGLIFISTFHIHDEGRFFFYLLDLQVINVHCSIALQDIEYSKFVGAAGRI